jgi:methionine biosynthesis protein MetW
LSQIHPRFERTGDLGTERRLDPYVEAYIPDGARVMDLGCGYGDLLDRLIEHRRIFARGVEISSEGLKACIQRGLSVYQGDIDEGFEDFSDGIFDFVILNLTLSMLHHPDRVLREVARIGKQAIVTFYNAGYHPRRQAFLRSGRAAQILPDQGPWYRNPHIHPFSVADFEALCAELDLQMVARTFVDEQFARLVEPFSRQPQVWSHAAVYLLQQS